MSLLVHAPWPTISADPAWRFHDEGRRGGIRERYATLTLDKILRMPVVDLVTPDASLYLWVPNALILDGTGAAVCRAWGFEPFNLITWCKAKGLGTGRRFRNTTEQAIYAVRGKPPSLARNLPTHYYWPRSEHSEKPPEFYRRVVERMSPGPYLELFSRYARPGWNVWGDEVLAASEYVSLPQIALSLVDDHQAPYVCLGCEREYAWNPAPDADDCPGCGEKLAPKKRVEAARGSSAAARGEAGVARVRARAAGK